MNEVCLTDSEEESDHDDPETTPHDIIGKATICKFYGVFKKAIGTKPFQFISCKYIKFTIFS